MKLKNGLHQLLTIGAIQLLICGSFAAKAAVAQVTLSTKADDLAHSVGSELASELRKLPGGLRSITPTPTAISTVLDLFSSSPLTRQDQRQPQPAANQTSFAQAGTPSTRQRSDGAQTPITIQLPPPPPERYAPAPQWRPPIQVPDPLTIPSPPLTQAPPLTKRPPIQMPNPSGVPQVMPPIQLPSIPLPPHPPEEQAPWRQGG